MLALKTPFVFPCVLLGAWGGMVSVQWGSGHTSPRGRLWCCYSSCPPQCHANIPKAKPIKKKKKEKVLPYCSCIS